MPYIPALDGIRTLAVAAVVLYHLNPSLVPGGMQGVTVFFVLSGYLITRLLLSEHKGTGRIDLKGFWQRRLRRLVPAIVTVIVATAALCTLFNHVMLTKMRPDIIPSALFVNNWWQIFNQQSYFNAIGDPSQLTHFWSLAIEMQFYLVWPVALMLALRHGEPKKRIRRPWRSQRCRHLRWRSSTIPPPTPVASTTAPTHARSPFFWELGSHSSPTFAYLGPCATPCTPHWRKIASGISSNTVQARSTS